MGTTSPKVLQAKPFVLKHTTPQQRVVSHTLNAGMEQDVSGFDSLNLNQDQYWAVLTGETPVIRGDYTVDNKGNYLLDLAKAVSANASGITITIRPDAYWYWQGHAKAPVTVNDYIYTWQQIMKPGNDVASTTGYSNITGYHVYNSKKIKFNWSTPFADYRDLFGFILPKAAFSGIAGGFNNAWTNCVCGSDGNPVSDGPYYLQKYTVGGGVTLKATPAGYWYGHAPALTTVNFILYPDQTSEYQAYNQGLIDWMAPAPDPNFAPFIHKPGTKFSATAGIATQEHIDVNLKGDSGGTVGGKLLGNLWFRQAVMEGIDRQGIINAVFTGIAKGLKPLNNPIFSTASQGGGQYAYMAPYNYNPGKAFALLKAHCKGGPTKPSKNNTKVWTCAGKQAVLNFRTTTRATRVTSSAIIKQDLMSIGIKINVDLEDKSVFFGSTTPNKHFDLAEFAWIGGLDPSGTDSIFQCQVNSKNLGGQNYKNFCSGKVDNLFKAGDKQLNATKRIADYENAAKIISKAICVIPLYGPPNYLIYRSTLQGLQNANNPTSVGPTWNIETWHY
jgi:ABC-type transport system substrate-binding protein